MSLVRIREKSQITLPKQIMRDYQLCAGDMVDIEVSGKKLKIRGIIRLERSSKKQAR